MLEQHTIMKVSFENNVVTIAHVMQTSYKEIITFVSVTNFVTVLQETTEPFSVVSSDFN